MDIDPTLSANCPDCGKSIGVQMRRCPGCGRWVRPFSTNGVPSDRPVYRRGDQLADASQAAGQEWVGEGQYIRRAKPLPRGNKRH
jgi:hypothetical protein